MERWKVEQADCIEFLNSLPADSADLVFGSPPYEKCRLYLENGEDLGIARDTEEWVAWMVEVSKVARRVCRGLVAWVVEGQTRGYRYSCSPFLLAADLHRAGFHLRKPPIYKRVGIPGSGGPDWLRNDYEPIICFTRGGKLPWSDNTACGHPPKWGPGGEMSYRRADGARKNAVPKMGSGECRNGSKRRKVMTKVRAGTHSQESTYYEPPDLANPGNIIDCIVGGGNMGSHLCSANEAPFPEKLADFFIRSFAPPGGLVVDPFSGSGTTGARAKYWNRNFHGCDLRQSQVELSRLRIAEVTPDMFETLEKGIDA